MLQKHTDQQKMVFPASAQSLSVYFNDLTVKVLMKTHQIFFKLHKLIPIKRLKNVIQSVTRDSDLIITIACI